MRTLAIANHKGGVGKTTTAVNLAAGLARTGYRTLLVDVDAQAHATFWFVEDSEEVEFDLQDVISKGVPIEKTILRTRIDRLDLLPATLALAPLETELVLMTRREDRVQRSLVAVADSYDFAVLDLPPSLSLLTLAALVAATDVIAPVSATKLAVGGLGAFLAWTDDFRAEGLITAPLLGILITMADPRTRVAREVTDALHSSTLPVFHTIIPRRIAAEDQVGDRLVLGDPEANVDLAHAYRAFTHEVLARTGVRRG
jgi:chromosome partitioning protein